jgi:hypothetical protein
MIAKAFILLCLPPFAFSGPMFGQTSPEASPASTVAPSAETAAVGQPPSEEETSLDLVIREVKKALQKYQDNLGRGADVLPPLKSAEFNFNVITSQKVGGSINLFILKFGASVEKTTTNEVAYTYAVPGPSAKADRAKGPPPSLDDVLAQTIQEAAKTVKQSATLNNLQFKQLVVTIQYGVNWVGSGGITGTYSFVTVGLDAEKSKKSAQSVKLTFETPEKPKKPTPPPTPTPTPRF